MTVCVWWRLVGLLWGSAWVPLARRLRIACAGGETGGRAPPTGVRTLDAQRQWIVQEMDHFGVRLNLEGAVAAALSCSVERLTDELRPL